jgi:nitroreductase
MNVTQAIKQRHSARAYLDKPVSQQQVQSILEVARFAPSGVNTQPWQVAVISGQSKLSLQQQMQTAFQNGEKESMDYHYYPTQWVEPYKSRRATTGAELYNALNIEREDKKRRLQQWQANYRAFDAPVMLLFFLDPSLETGAYLDYGLFLQNIMLLAEEQGLATCPQGALGEFPKLIKNFLNYDASLILLGGIALGYEDKDHAVNQYRTNRVEVTEFTQFFE